MKEAPAVVIADPRDCSVQFVPSELKAHIKLSSSCDILKNLLNKYSVSYTSEDAPPGAMARVKIGNMTIEGVDLKNLTVSKFFRKMAIFALKAIFL